MYHSQSPEAMYAHSPGIKIVAPSNPYDAKGLLIAAIRDPDPVLFLEHKRAYRLIKGRVPAGPYTLPIGKARLSRTGRHISVITYGLMVHQTMKAAAHLAQEDIDVEVLDLRTLKPLDEEAILATVRKTGKVLRVEPKQDRVYVEGLNIVKRHQRPQPGTGQGGGVIEREGPIHVSNVMLIDPKDDRPTRIGIEIHDGKRLRIARRSGNRLD